MNILLLDLTFPYLQGKQTTPFDSSANQEIPPNNGTPSSQPISSGAVLNKGSSTTTNQLDTGDNQAKQETSSPDRDGLKYLQKSSKRISEEEKQSGDSAGDSSPKMARFVEYLVKDKDNFSNNIEHYFDDDDMEKEAEKEP